MKENNSETIAINFLSRSRHIFFPALFITSMLFVFVPASLYVDNIFSSIDFFSVLYFYAIPFFVLLIALLVIGFIVRPGGVRLYVSLLFAIGLLLWIQSGLMVWDYGSFDGEPIKWAGYRWQGWVDTTVWAALIIAALIFSRRVYKFSGFMSIVFICLQLGVLLTSYFAAPDLWHKEKNAIRGTVFTPALSEYSSSFNIVHILFDSFQGDIFLELVKERDMWDDFDGFVYFKENISTAATTWVAMPTIFSSEQLSGDARDEDLFVRENVTLKGFPNRLYDNGYTVNIITLPGIARLFRKSTHRYENPDSGGASLKERKVIDAAFLMDATLFRLTPHYIKRMIYNDLNWTIKPLVPGVKAGFFYQKEVFKRYTDGLKVKGSKPAYHFVHILPPHLPSATNADCEYAGEVLDATRENYKIDADCMLRQFFEFTGKLKELGLYDSSLIVFHGDHGAGFPPLNISGLPDAGKGELKFNPSTIGRSSTLLAVKLPGAKGLMRVSDALTTLKDIPATIMDVAGLPHRYGGSSVFKLDPAKDRARWYRGVYKLSGSLFDYNSWSEEKMSGTSEAATIKPYKWGFELIFGNGQTARFYQSGGWFYFADNRWAWVVDNGAYLSMFVDPPGSDITLRAEVEPYLLEGKVDKQRVEVVVNGKSVGIWVLDKAGVQTRSMTIPRRFFTGSNRLEIAFKTPDAAVPTLLGDKDYTGFAIALSVKFHKLTMTEGAPKAGSKGP